MENEETESLELVPIEEVEVDLIFSPAQGESQLIGYGSRKIIRESLKNQLSGGYKCLDYSAITLENGKKLSKIDSNILAIVNLLVDSAHTKKELAAKARLTETQVGHVLNILMKFGFVEMIKSKAHFTIKFL